MRARSALARAAAALLALGLAAPASAWGYRAHRMVNRAAVGTLPAGPLRTLFANNVAYVGEHSVDPDLERYRASDPDHFLDMDAFGGGTPLTQLPKDEAEHLRRQGAGARALGRLPWRAAEEYAALVAALRAGEPLAVLDRAARLGHLLGDAHVPLHAARNHNGQLTGQDGLHGRWESQLVDRFESQIRAELAPSAAVPAGDVFAATVAALHDSYAAHLETLAADREVARGRDLLETRGDDRYSDLYFSAFFARERGRVVGRMAAAASLVGGAWLQAWEDAGRPALDEAFQARYVRGERRAVLLTLDGASAPVFEDAVARGVMPQLAALRQRGATADSVRPPVPVKTAVGHASLYTGTWPDRHGIGGNQLSPPEESVLATGSGLLSLHLRAEPVWVTVAREDMRATVVGATQSYPTAPYTSERRFAGDYGSDLTLIDFFQNLQGEEAAYTARELASHPAGTWLGELPPHAGEAREFALSVAGVALDGLLYDDPADPVAGLDTLLLTVGRDPASGAVLKPAPAGDGSAFATLRVRLAESEAVLHFRLFALAPDGSDLLLYQASPVVLRSNQPAVEQAIVALGSPAIEAAHDLYEHGRLGPPLWEGGDGLAERRYLDTVRYVRAQIERLNLFCLERSKWDLLVLYLPFPDEVLHAWAGRLDPTLPGHDPRVAAALRGYLDEVLRDVDGFLGRLAAKLPEDAVLAVASDHGLAGASRSLKPNVALAGAGLLALDARGRPDLARSRALYFPGNMGFVLLNRSSRPGGIVGPAEEEAVRRQVIRVLEGIRDPQTGKPIVRDAFTPAERPGTGGPNGGDVYLALAPGYGLAAAATGPLVEDIPPVGVHVTDPERPELQATLTLAGPGVARGVRLGAVRMIDVAPTLSALLGIGPPAQATGTVLRKALEWPDVPLARGVAVPHP